MSRAAACVTKLPAMLAVCSAITYFGFSEGIRNHVLLLVRVLRMVVEQLP